MPWHKTGSAQVVQSRSWMSVGCFLTYYPRCLGQDLRYYQKHLFKVKNKAKMYEIIYLNKREEQNPNLEFDSFF